MCYIKKVLQKNSVLVLAYVALGVFNAFLTNYKAVCFQKVIDEFTTGYLALAGILFYGFVLILNYGMNYLDNYPDQKLQHGIYLDFKLLALHKISTIDYMAYQKVGTGKIVQRIENGAEAGKNVLYNFWLRLIRELLPTILFSICFIWKINRNITCVLLIGYVVIFIITNILLKFLYQIKEKILDNEERLNHYLVRGFMEMPLFRMKKQFSNEITKATGAKEEIVSAKVKMTLIHEAFFTIFALLVAILDVGILLYAWNTKSLSVGSVVALISLIENAYTPVAIFNVIYVQYKLDRASFARLEQFLRTKDDVHLQRGKTVKEIGNICVTGLSFQYQERKIFNELNLSIQKGEKVAFVGESGSGKSTLVKLLTGLLKYDNGQIYFGDTDLKDICLNDLYEKLSYLSQDAPVFDGTIKENLVFDREFSSKQLTEVLEKVQLSHLLANSEQGLETEIGEKGTSLSGGEKQRLALARLWFDNSEIVILDEATSAMDNLTEENVMREVIRRLQGQTVIAIAHRLHSIIGFDRIIVFREGKIVGQGTFEELISSNAYFAELYRADLQSQN